MLVSALRTQVCYMTGFSASDATVTARILAWTNLVRRELAKECDWSFLQKSYILQTVAPYNTGTVSVDVAGTSVTGLGTTFTADMVGRYIGFSTSTGNTTDWYRISKFTNTTTIVIDTPYTGGTALSGASYTIHKVFFRVPGDARTINSLIDFYTPTVLQDIPNYKAFNINNPEFNTSGQMSKFTYWGKWGKETTYTTGTVSGSDDSRTLTGSGTAWLSNVLPGDKIEINGNTDTYMVDTVDSDTQITLYQKLSAAVTAATTYTATTDPDSVMIRFAYIPDEKRNVIVNYYHSPAPLVQDNDEDEFLRLYPELVIEGVLSMELKAAEDTGWQSIYTNWKSISIPRTIGARKKSGTWTPNMTRYNP
jgi:hypothetical protein